MARGGCLLKVVTMLACCLATGASAEVLVEGNLTALRVSASGDSLSNVLLAFGTLSPVRLRAAIPLNAEIKATYSGSLSHVVSRLLDGYNYVIKNEDGLTEILVLGNAGEVAIPPKARLVKGALSRWR